MDSLLLLNSLPFLNLLALGVIFIYLIAKGVRHSVAVLFLISLLPLFTFELGSHLVVQTGQPARGALLIALGITLSPLGFISLSQGFLQKSQTKLSRLWLLYYVIQLLILGFVVEELMNGQVIRWVTGILDQPVILIERNRRFLFLNVLIASGLSLFCFENTLRNAGGPQLESLKYVVTAFLGFIVYFSYIAWNIFTYAHILPSMLLSGAAIISVGILLLTYSLAKYPLWQIKINPSRRVVCGCLTFAALLIYLVISGSLLGLLLSFQPHGYGILFPAAVFALSAILLLIYLSPYLRKRIEILISRNFFRTKYDYRELWIKFSEKSSGSLSLNDLLPKVAEFIADAMFVRQVAIWLQSQNAASFSLAYCHDPLSSAVPKPTPIRLNPSGTLVQPANVYHIAQAKFCNRIDGFPLESIEPVSNLGIDRLVPVAKGNRILGFLGVGPQLAGSGPSEEDNQLLSSISSQLAHLILTHRLSEELLLAREWESFNRLSSFIVHDLKNLATLQSMTLENARTLHNNPGFLADSFATFGQTTEKMIKLIASLSVERRQVTFKQQPVNILEIMANAFDDLKIGQKNGIEIITTFPPEDSPPVICGDPQLLKKVFTNILLNAIQSFPDGHGRVEVSVSRAKAGRIKTSIKDTGCGISPEQLGNLFRPFQTTKKEGTGIGLCHTRSIVEIHGGQIRIESHVNSGTQVDIELPTLT
jgi:putative PEP-CTERM system histidine kinase